jgi:probable F420-dependent oxidoreductase
MKFALSTFMTPVEQLPEIAQTAEAAGWQMVTMSDHVVNPQTLTTPYPYTDDGSRRWPEFTDWADQLVTMGALATCTKTIRFNTNAFVLPMRNPFLVAKAIATISVLSGNRQVLTIGVGWSKDEFALLGQDFHTRGKRCDEMIEVMKLIWSGKYVSYDGQYYKFDNVESNPKPAGPVPIWTGGISQAALKRAARLADGWLTDFQPAADIVSSIQQIQAMRKELGRDHLPFDVMATPADVWDVDGLKKIEEQGVTHIIGTPWLMYFQGPTTLEQKKDAIKRYADDFISKLP